MTLTKTSMRVITCLIATVALSLSLVGLAFADTYSRSCDVTFTSNKRMTSTFAESGYGDAVAEMEPGDSVVLTIKIKNDYTAATDWYMTNEVLKTLEDGSSASGGGYTYELTYNGDVITSSETVGGDVNGGKQGLYGATSNMPTDKDGNKEFFFVGTLDPSKSGTVVLKVSLDGNTMSNSYRDTLARLMLNFAVELPGNEVVQGTPQTSEPATTGNTDEGTDKATDTDKGGSTIPKMGDYEWAMLSAFCSVAGVALLVLGFLSYRSDRKRKEATND